MSYTNGEGFGYVAWRDDFVFRCRRKVVSFRGSFPRNPVGGRTFELDRRDSFLWVAGLNPRCEAQRGMDRVVPVYPASSRIASDQTVILGNTSQIGTVASSNQ